MGLLFSKKELEAWASKLAGRQVGVSWYKNFMKQHWDDISAAKGVQLNPKRTSNFNKTVINDYFDRLEALHGHFSGGIPAEHIWNMDEKGIQLGGGCKIWVQHISTQGARNTKAISKVTISSLSLFSSVSLLLGTLSHHHSVCRVAVHHICVVCMMINGEGIYTLYNIYSQALK